MPILAAETHVFPADLLTPPEKADGSGRNWWVLHTKPRQEKSLARQLFAKQIPFYLPLIEQTRRIRGRKMTSHIPLFAGYLFMHGRNEDRVAALTTQRIVRTLAAPDEMRLWQDLSQIERMIASGEPITPEDRLAPGMEVEINSGPLMGLKGTILKTASGRRFVVKVDFIQQGASILLDDYTLVRAQ